MRRGRDLVHTSSPEVTDPTGCSRRRCFSLQTGCVRGDRPDVGEHAAGVPGWKGSYQRREAVELNAAVARSLGPGELASVPFDEGFGIRRDVEVLVEARARLGDLGVSELDE